MESPLIQKPIIYTEEDYYNLPEGFRSELIDGQFYKMAPPSRKHQEILMYLSKVIAIYIDSKDGSCKVYPAPFAVKLREGDKTLLNRIFRSYPTITNLQTADAPDRRTG